MRFQHGVVWSVLAVAAAAAEPVPGAGGGHTLGIAKSSTRFVSDPYLTACVSSKAWKKGFDMGGCPTWWKDFREFASDEKKESEYDPILVKTCTCLASYFTWLAPRALNPMPYEMKLTVKQNPLVYPPSSRPHPFVTLENTEIEVSPLPENSKRRLWLRKALRSELRAITRRLKNYRWKSGNSGLLVHGFTLLPQMAMFCSAFKLERESAEEVYISDVCKAALQILESTTIEKETFLVVPADRCLDLHHQLNARNRGNKKLKILSRKEDTTSDRTRGNPTAKVAESAAALVESVNHVMAPWRRSKRAPHDTSRPSTIPTGQDVPVPAKRRSRERSYFTVDVPPVPAKRRSTEQSHLEVEVPPVPAKRPLRKQSHVEIEVPLSGGGKSDETIDVEMDDDGDDDDDAFSIFPDIGSLLDDPEE